MNLNLNNLFVSDLQLDKFHTTAALKMASMMDRNLWLLTAVIFYNYDVIMCQLTYKPTVHSNADGGYSLQNSTAGDDAINKKAPSDVTKNGIKTDVYNRPPEKSGNGFQMPPFIIGACSVLVIYGFFHCLYVHCYTEKRVETIATRTIARAPTIIVHDDPASASGMVTNSY